MLETANEADLYLPEGYPALANYLPTSHDAFSAASNSQAAQNEMQNIAAHEGSEQSQYLEAADEHELGKFLF